MKNKLIISEFERLIAYIKNELIEKAKDKKEINKQNFRLRQFTKVLYILKKYPETINKKNYKELLDLDGIGKGTLDRVKEILDTKKLSEIGNFKDASKEKKKAMKDLESVIGIGKTIAKKYYNQGISSVSQLKKMHKKGEIELNEKILLGLKYYKKYKQNIPRKEIDQILKFLKKEIEKINKTEKLTTKNRYCLEICGSYRRQQPSSNDIDVLLTKLGTKEDIDCEPHLVKFISKLKELNFLIDDMTDKKIKTKYMGFCKYKSNPIRRIDVRFVPYTSYYSAILYFTGSNLLNQKMRRIAKKKGYKLSEYGLFQLKTDKKVIVKSEKDIFKKLDMDYIEPKLR